MNKILLSKDYVIVHNFWKRYKVLILLLFIAFLLRFVLVVRGGQFYWPDESRYMKSHRILYFLKNGDIKGAVVFIVGIYVHFGFVLASVIAEFIRYLFLSLCMPNMALKPELLLITKNALWVPALFLATASIISIALVYAIAHKSGAQKREGIIAALMMTCSTTMFYYARHFLPYDVSMAMALFAICIGLNIRMNVWKSLVCGLMAGLSFMTYNGYWSLALVAVFIHIFWGKRSVWEMIKRGVIAAAGFVILPISLTIISVISGNKPFLLGMVDFATTRDNQGYFGEGWLFVWEYLWQAEHLLLLVWLVSAGALLWLFLKRRQFIPTRAVNWLTAVGVIYFILFLLSTVLKKQEPLGRIARQMVPFFCLITAYACEIFIHKYKDSKRLRLLYVLAVAVIVIQVAVNFKQPLMQRFPSDIQRLIMVKYGIVSQDITVEGPVIQGAGQKNCFSRYVLLNAQHLYPIYGTKSSPKGTILFKTSHPLQYIPYQYEGYAPKERFILRTSDISMRLIDRE
jgi:hypothetical protein